MDIYSNIDIHKYKCADIWIYRNVDMQKYKVE